MKDYKFIHHDENYEELFHINGTKEEYYGANLYYHKDTKTLYISGYDTYIKKEISDELAFLLLKELAWTGEEND